MQAMKEQFIHLIHDLQNRICVSLEEVDGKARFVMDNWKREGGGGGKTRVIANGNVFEKGGVNTSVVHGVLPELIRSRFGVDQGWFLAAGISLVIHPRSPLVPTVHANYRYFELYDHEGGTCVDAWFGDGADLTPYYLDRTDARHFHRVHKQACDQVAADLYPDFKKQCDAYFHNTHRGESRGIGGIFYDYLRPLEITRYQDEPTQSTSHTVPSQEDSRQGVDSDSDRGPHTVTDSGNHQKSKHSLTFDQLYNLAALNGQAFIDAYVPIAQEKAGLPYTDDQRYWQELRRGRYVEFNLIHDRGTLFGLKTNGRVESILMSLPPRVRWDYDAGPQEGTPEAALIEVLRQPVDWLQD